jgi:hypothetical protein
MNKIDHARILNAYLASLTLSDMKAIYEQNKKWMDACLNGNNVEQLQCRAGFYALVANATNNLIQHDIRYIEQVINEETEGVTS